MVDEADDRLRLAQPAMLAALLPRTARALDAIALAALVVLLSLRLAGALGVLSWAMALSIAMAAILAFETWEALAARPTDQPLSAAPVGLPGLLLGASLLCVCGGTLVRGWSFYTGATNNWDNHTSIEKELPPVCTATDQPIAALLRDLKNRGLFEDTLVIWTTEFGRMPFTQGATGRDHNGGTFVTWLAGAGVRTGTAYGASDPFSYQAAQGKTYCYDLHATVLHLLGIDHEKLTFRHDGIDRRLTDVHDNDEISHAAEVADVIQIPAFLSRQTGLIRAAARSGRAVNVKKGQFLAPDDMAQVIEKLTAAGCEKILLTERGTTFGYHDLVVDMRGLVAMRSLGWPVVYDATHSLQKPGGIETGGDRRYAFPLMRAAVACGVDGLFFEAHPDPARALSDAGTQLPLAEVEAFLDDARRVRAAVSERAHA